MANVNIANIKAPQSPNLPIAPNVYSQEYFNLFSNSLRLYFNQLDKLGKYLMTPDIGKYLNFPFIAVLDDTIQSAVSAGVAYPVTWSTPYLPSYYTAPSEELPYIDLVDSSKIVIPNSHYYDMSYTLTFNKSTTGGALVAVWFRLTSGLTVTDYPGTTRYYAVLGDDVPISANASIVVDETNGDSWQIMWATSDADVVLTPTPGAVIGPEPTGTSATLAITFVSA